MHAILKYLGSRTFTTWLSVAYVVFLVFLSAWGFTSPSMIVENISGLAPFWLVYIFAALNLLIAFWVFLPITLKRINPLPPTDFPLALSESNAESIENKLKSLGYTQQWNKEHTLITAYRSKYTPWASWLFHGALILLPLASYISYQHSFRGDLWLQEGYSFSGELGDYLHTQTHGDIQNTAPDLEFKLLNVEAECWRDKLFFTKLQALIAHGKNAESRSLTSISSPARINSTNISISGFNYSP